MGILTLLLSRQLLALMLATIIMVAHDPAHAQSRKCVSTTTGDVICPDGGSAIPPTTAAQIPQARPQAPAAARQDAVTRQALNAKSLYRLPKYDGATDVQRVPTEKFTATGDTGMTGECGMSTPVGAVTAPTSLEPLEPAPLPAHTAISATDGVTWTGTAPVAGSDGVIRLTPIQDPKGSGRIVNMHRVLASDPEIWGGQRSELLWNDIKLEPGHDYWMAFAIQRKKDETLLPTTDDDTMLVFQTHTPQPGDTQPDIGLFASGQSGQMEWRSAFNASGKIDSRGWMGTEGNPKLHNEPLMEPGVWWRYIIHYRPGYDCKQSPQFRVWRATPGGEFQQLFNHTGLNTYNTSVTGAGASYPRMGPYKWSTSAWNTNSIAWYQSTLYIGEGANLLESAMAALSGF